MKFHLWNKKLAVYYLPVNEVTFDDGMVNYNLWGSKSLKLEAAMVVIKKRIVKLGVINSGLCSQGLV